MNRPTTQNILNPWTIQWVVAFSFGLRYFLSDRLPPLPHESWEVLGWSPAWEPELRWFNLGIFLLFILTWFWLNRRQDSNKTVRPILLFHFFTPIMVLSATWSPLPFVWLVLLLCLTIALEAPKAWRWAAVIPCLAMSWVFPQAIFFLPGLTWTILRSGDIPIWLSRLGIGVAIALSLAVTFGFSRPGQPSIELLSKLAFQLGWANLSLLCVFSLAALFTSLKYKKIEPFDLSLLWLVLPPLGALLSCQNLEQAMTLAALPFPFLLALICRFAFSRPAKLPFALACLALSLSHIQTGLDGVVPKHQPWLHVEWAANAEKSYRLSTLMETLEKEMGSKEQIILTSPDKEAILNLLSQHPVLSYPSAGPNSSYAHLHQSGFWVLEAQPQEEHLEKAKSFLGGLRFWKQVSIGRNGQERQHFWVLRFDQLKMPF